MNEKIIRTVDIAVTFRGSILLIKRTKAPFMDKLVLPGGHVEAGENLLAAAVRELEEEVGLRLDVPRLRELKTLNAPDRDPRPGRRVSVVFIAELSSADEACLCHAGSDAASLHWRHLSSLSAGEIGFDHFEAIRLLF